jgi:aspartate/methionine/tyrosine aminotransferase
LDELSVECQNRRVRLNPTFERWNIGETVIRKMTRLAHEHGAVNLSQGLPDFDTPEPVRAAAVAAIQSGHNQYSYPFGIPELRRAIADKVRRFNGLDWVDPEHIVVTLGATEAITSVLGTIASPGDEVVFFEPFHESYLPQVRLNGLMPRTVAIDPLTGRYDAGALDRAITDRTAAILLNTPHNPTGKVFTPDELEHIAELVTRHDVMVLTDEIYEHIIYDDARHISPATLTGMRERTFTINAMSKTFAATGWRVGWVICPPAYTRYLRAVHDVTVIQAPTPLQFAAVAALALPDSYFETLAGYYLERRELLISALRAVGFTCRPPEGAYYVMADFSALEPALSAAEFATKLLIEAKVACVPGSNFYMTPGLGERQVRFAFCKQIDTIEAAVTCLVNAYGRR